MEKIPFSILKEDYENSSKNFQSIMSCPMAMAFRRQFPQYYMTGVDPWGINDLKGRIAKVSPAFMYADFEDLSKGTEFHTFITFNTEENGK